MSRTQLPTIFPWSTTPIKRRIIVKNELIEKKKKVVMHPTETKAVNELSSEHEVHMPEVYKVVDDLLDSVAKELEHPVTDNPNIEQNAAEGKLSQEMEDLRKQVESLKRELNELKTKPKFNIDDHKASDENIAFFTGFPNYDMMVFCFDLLKDKAANMNYGNIPRANFDPNKRKPGSRRKITLWQEFTLVSMRLRLGLLEKDLAERFRVAVSTVSSIRRTWIRFMRIELEPVCIQWPSKQQIMHYMPPIFKKLYPSLVSIIDCTEIQLESPSSLDKRSLCYSSYKSRTTMKALIGITPNGVVSFCSDLYCGSISDPDIVKKSGYLKHIQIRDTVMADKDFTIRAVL